MTFDRIRHYLLATLFVLVALVAAAESASATEITVAAQTIENWRYTTTQGNGVVQLRIYVDRSFITSDGRPVLPGSPQGGAVYKIVPCNLGAPDANGNYTLTVTQFDIDSTTDAQDPPGMSAKYTAFFFTPQGRQLAVYGGFEQFRVLPVYATNPATWAQIRADNTANAAIPTQTRSYTDQQINQRIVEAIAGSSGLTSLEGQTGPAVTFTDDTNIMMVGSGNVITVTWASTLAVPRGGLGVGTLAANGVLYGNGTSAVGVTAQGAANSVLVANAGVPSFSQSPTINTSLTIGVASTQTGSLILRNSTNANTITIAPGVTSASWAWTLPTDDGAANGLLVTDGSGVSSWTNTPTVTSLTSSGLTAGRVIYASTAGLLADDSGFLWDATNNRLSIGTTLATNALQLANATYLGGSNAAGSSVVRAIGIDANDYVSIAQGGNRSVFGGVVTSTQTAPADLSSGDAAIFAQYQIAPIATAFAVRGTYSSNSPGNNFNLASYATTAGTRATVALYGQAVATDVTGTVAWGMNPVALTLATGTNVASGIAIEANFGSIANSSAAENYGLVLASVGHSVTYGTVAGTNKAFIQMQVSTGMNSAASPANGIVFDSTVANVIQTSGSLITVNNATTGVYGLDLRNFNASNGGVILQNNDFYVGSNAANTLVMPVAGYTSGDLLQIGHATYDAAGQLGIIIYPGSAETIRVARGASQSYAGLTGFNQTTPAYQIHATGITSRTLSGTSYNVTNGSPTVTATSSQFVNELAPGSSIEFSSQPGTVYTVQSIASATSLTLSANYTGSNSVIATATADRPAVLFESASGDDWMKLDNRHTLVLSGDSAFGDERGTLQINSRRDANRKLLLGYDHTNNQAYITAIESGVAQRDLIIQGGGGYVGIGQNAPTAQLHVAGGGAKTGNFINSKFDNTATSVSSFTKISLDVANQGSWVGPNIGLRSTAEGAFDASLNRTNYAAVLSGGQTLFGPGLGVISSPTAWLHAYALPTTNFTAGGGVTVTATNASAAVTGVGTTFTSYRPGMAVSFGSDATVYEILSITDNTNLTLTAVYGAATQTPENSYIDPQLVKITSGAGAEKFRVLGNETGVVHLEGIGAAPTIAAGTGAGTTPTVSIAGTDIAGTISVLTGAAPATSSTVVTVTFNRQWGGTTIPKIIIVPTNRAAAELSGTSVPYVTQASTTTTSWVITSGSVALGTPVTYTWSYLVIQ